MKNNLLSILTIIVVAGSLRAQPVHQPIPPPDTVFPLGGLTGAGSNAVATTVAQQLPNFGLNMEYNGPLPLGPGQTSVGGTGSGLGGHLNDFVPSGTYGLGYNPLFAEWDFNLASNESGITAWDLWSNWELAAGTLNANNEWFIPIPPLGSDLTLQGHPGYYLWGLNQPLAYNSSTLYQQGQQVTFSTGDPTCPYTVWRCNQANSKGQTPSCSTSSPWGHYDLYSSGNSYNLGDMVSFTPSDPNCQYILWYCTHHTSGNNPGCSSPFWVPANQLGLGTLAISPYNSSVIYTKGMLATFSTGVSSCPNAYWTCIQQTLGDGSSTCNPGCSSNYWVAADPQTLGMFPGPAPVAAAATPNFYIDFVSRVDRLAYSSISDPTTGIYALELSVVWSDFSNSITYTYSTDGGQTWTTATGSGIQDIPITINDLEYAGNGGNFTPLSNENLNLLNFPNPKLEPQTKNYSSNPYTIKRIKIQTNGKTPIGITLNLKNLNGNANGIYVRGVRIRSDYADHLYRNDFYSNSTLSDGDQISTSILSMLNGVKSSTTSSNWKLTEAINIGNECNWESWRPFAYLNEAWRNWTKQIANGGKQKDIYTIVTGGIDLTWWRPIYEDQSYTQQFGVDPPPPLQNESIEFGINYGILSPPWQKRRDHDFTSGNLIFAGDDIPSEVKNHLDASNHRNFIELGRAISGWGNGSYGATPMSGNSGNSYSTYTSLMQAELEGIGSINQISALSCYPQDRLPLPNKPSIWTRYYSYPSTFESVNDGGNPPGLPSYSPQNFNNSQLQKDLLSDLKNGTTPTAVFSWTLPYNSSWSSADLAAINPQLTPVIQPATSWEIRAQTWSGLAWGAKGIIYNPMGDDGAFNIGFCGNNFESNINNGFSYLSDGITPMPYGDASYWYYGLLQLSPSIGYLIPPATPTSQSNVCFPDHLIISNPYQNGCYLWIPCLSDFTVWSSLDHSKIDINPGDPITSSLIGEYLNAVQNYNPSLSPNNIGEPYLTSGKLWSISQEMANSLPAYYSQHLPPPLPQVCDPTTNLNNHCIPCVSSWMAAAYNLTQASEFGSIASDPSQNDWTKGNWVAGDRDLDEDFKTISDCNNSVRGPCRNSSQTPHYDWWPWAVPFSFPTSAVKLALTGVPTYYGVKDRSDGVKYSTADVSPIARELKNLQWHGTINVGDVPYSDWSSAYDPATPPTTDWANYPIMEDIWNCNFPNSSSGGGNSGGSSDGSQNTDVPPCTEDRTFEKTERFTATFTARDPGAQFFDEPSYSAYESDKDGYFQNPGSQQHPYPFDKSVDRHLTVGRFTDPNEPRANYAVIANPRTWPIRYGDVTQTSILSSDNGTLLGAIDRRRINFKLRWDLLDPANLPDHDINFWDVTNLRTGEEFIKDISKHFDPTTHLQTDVFHVDLDPGEGTLVRIAPATAVDLGRTNYAGIAYNNGNRTAIINTGTPPCPGAPQPRPTTYESNGSIIFNLAQPAGANPGDITSSAISVYTPSYSNPPSWIPNQLLDSAHNPSIGLKTGSNGDTIAIVFSVDAYAPPSPNPHASERAVMFAYSTDQGASWNNSPIRPLISIAGKGSSIPLTYYQANVPDVTGNGYDLVTPVITPISDGFVMAYANNRDIHPVWVHWVGGIGGNWVSVRLKTPTPGASTTDLRMPSLASRDDFTVPSVTCPPPSPSSYERIHFCYESDYGNGNSVIFYWPIEHALDCAGHFSYGDITPLGWAVEVSQPYCLNYHPHVAVLDDNSPGGSGLGLPIVTWEITDPAGCPCPPFCDLVASTSNPVSIPGCWASDTRAAVRYMTAPGKRNPNPPYTTSPTTWSQITTFHKETNNLSQPVTRPLDKFCSGSSATELAEVAYQDTFSHQEFIARQTSGWGVSPVTWSFNRIEEYAQWGSVSLPYEKDFQEDFGSIMYRGIYPDENGLFAAKIAANPDPTHADEVSAPNEAIPLYKFSVTPIIGGSSPCGPPPIGIQIYSGPCLTCSGTIQQGPIPILTPMFLNHPLAAFFEMPAPYDTSVGGGGSYDSSITSQFSSDSTANLVEQPPWPITEDSVRTVYFRANTQEVIEMKRQLIVDTSQIPALLPGINNQVSYKLVMKDSASGQVVAVLDSATIRGQSPIGGSYPGINPNDSTMMGMGYQIYDTVPPAPSGSAYITAIITKDLSTNANLASEVDYGDTLAFRPPIVDTSSDSSGPGYKKAPEHPFSASGSGQQLVVTVHPNPANSSVKVCVEDLPGGVPVQVDVVNQMGVSVATLYNATPEAELGLCLSLDCSQLPSGVYYADLQTNGSHKAVKFSVAH